MQRDYYTCYRSQRDMALNSFHVVILVYMAIVLISLGKYISHCFSERYTIRNGQYM